jgi:hypothetical protein
LCRREGGCFGFMAIVRLNRRCGRQGVTRRSSK